MNIKEIKIKRLGNHWYLNVNHESLDEIALDEKIERMLFILDRSGEGEFLCTIYETGCILYSNTIQFSDDSLRRYFTTNDDFNIDFWIGDRSFQISSTLYSLLEYQYEFNFHDTLYCIKICPNTY